LREYEKLARQCAAEGLDHVRFLARLVELELIDRERRMIERRIKAAKFPAVKSLDSFDFKAIPSLNKMQVLENDPDTLAQLGWRLAARGEFDEGIAYLEKAVARSANPPGWYFHLLAVRDYLKGDYQHMLEMAERSAVDGSGTSWSFIAIACAALGQPDEARAALDRWATIDPEAYRDPAAEYRMHGGTEETVNALVAGLRKAGWTAPDSATN
jgi:tetratricopeptide (TPR) repeat protein